MYKGIIMYNYYIIIVYILGYILYTVYYYYILYVLGCDSTGTPKVIPTPDFRISPGGRKHRKTQDNRE